MKRRIIKRWDEINRAWFVHYMRVWPDSVHVQSFRTTIFRPLGRAGYVGQKSKIGDHWIGREFLDDIMRACRGVSRGASLRMDRPMIETRGI